MTSRAPTSRQRADETRIAGCRQERAGLASRLAEEGDRGARRQGGRLRRHVARRGCGAVCGLRSRTRSCGRLTCLTRSALEFLKDLIGEQTDLIESTYYPISRFELSFWRNQTIHLFVEEAMLCAVLYTRVKAGGAAPSQRMERAEVLRELHFISRLLSNEFVYPPDGLEANSEKTIAALEEDEVILTEGELMGLNPKERAAGRNNFDFFCFLIWPFIETCESALLFLCAPHRSGRAMRLMHRHSAFDALTPLASADWLAAVSLFALAPTSAPPSADEPVAWYAEKAFQASAQLLAKTLFAQGDVSYLEAVNQGTYRGRAKSKTASLTRFRYHSHSAQRLPAHGRCRCPAHSALDIERGQRFHRQDGQGRQAQASEEAGIRSAHGAASRLGAATKSRRHDRARGQVVGVR